MLACAACCLATSFSSKAKSQPSTSTPLIAGRVLAGAARLAELERDLRHVAGRDRRVHRADVHHAAVLDAVQPGVAVERPRAVEVQDEAAVVGGHGRAPAPPRRTPPPARPGARTCPGSGRRTAHVRDAEQPLARGVDGEAPQVAGDPAPVQLLGDGRGGAAAAEAVENEVVFVGGSLKIRSRSASGFWVG